VNKTLAIGATVATTLGTTLAAATGAQATTQPDCTTLANYQTAAATAFAPTASDNWLTTCLPKFGFGKAEFTLSSDTDFPSDFKPLTDASVTLTPDWDAATLETYVAAPADGYLRNGLSRTDNGSNPRSQTYTLGANGNLFPFPIASITRVSTATVTAAAGCNNPTVPYTDAFRIDYAPLNIAVSEEAGGETWSTTVVIDPPSFEVGVVIDGAGGLTGTDSSLCILQGPNVYGSHDHSQFFSTAIDMYTNVGPRPSGDAPERLALGNFEFTHVAAPVALASTGRSSSEIYTWLGAGFAMILVGGLAASIRGRRRRRH
jgi:LPXTG-motif cell wall-anchored protein